MAEAHQPLLTVLAALDEGRDVLGVADAAEHPQDRLVGAAVERAVEGRGRGGERDVGVGLGGADGPGGARRAVLLVVRVEDEENVERPLEDRVGRVVLLPHAEEHVEEVAAVRERVVWVEVGTTGRVAEAPRGEGRHLGDDLDDVLVAGRLVADVLRLRVEGREGGDKGDQLAHHVGVVEEPVHRSDHVLVNERVVGDLILPGAVLVGGRKLAVEEEVGDLEEGRVLRQLLDRVAAVAQDSLVAVDHGDRRAAGGRVLVRRVVAEEAEVVAVRLDLPEVHGGDGPVLDRELVLCAGAVVGDRQRVGHLGLQGLAFVVVQGRGEPWREDSPVRLRPSGSGGRRREHLPAIDRLALSGHAADEEGNTCTQVNGMPASRAIGRGRAHVGRSAQVIAPQAEP